MSADAVRRLASLIAPRMTAEQRQRDQAAYLLALDPFYPADVRARAAAMVRENARTDARLYRWIRRVDREAGRS